MARPIITLTSDFGPGPYPGIMKGVILGICPQAALVDLSHAVTPQAVRAGALVLEQALAVFPPGTVHLAVVDPGVGTGRRPLCLQGLGMLFVGPDNGVFTYLWAAASAPCRAYELRHPAFRLPAVSATFHGRDIFAPAAGYAALGVPGRAFGPPIPDPVRLPIPPCEVDAAQREVRGQVFHADRFGNLLTSLGRWRPDPAGWRLTPWLNQGPEGVLTPRAVRLPSGERLPLVRTFGDLPPGQAGALVGSTGLLELVVNGGSAAERLGLRPGDPVWAVG